MSKARGTVGATAAMIFTLVATASLNANVGCVVTVTTPIELGERGVMIWRPSADHAGWLPTPISYVAPVGGNGCT